MEDFFGIMDAQFEHDLCNKSFDSVKEDENNKLDTFENRIKIWMSIARSGTEIPNNVYDYSFDESMKLFKKNIKRDEFCEILLTKKELIDYSRKMF